MKNTIVGLCLAVSTTAFASNDQFIHQIRRNCDSLTKLSLAVIDSRKQGKSWNHVVNATAHLDDTARSIIHTSFHSYHRMSEEAATMRIKEQCFRKTLFPYLQENYYITP